MTQTLKRGRLVLHGLRREPGGERVVQIEFGFLRKRYAYVCSGSPRVGSLVRASTPISGTAVVRPVVALGRTAYQGPLKRVTLVHR